MPILVSITLVLLMAVLLFVTNADAVPFAGVPEIVTRCVGQHEQIFLRAAVLVSFAAFGSAFGALFTVQTTRLVIGSKRMLLMLATVSLVGVIAACVRFIQTYIATTYR